MPRRLARSSLAVLLLALLAAPPGRAAEAVPGLRLLHEGRFPEAARRFKERADAGDARAQYLYAEMLARGYGVARDREAARALAERAGRGRLPQALGLVARLAEGEARRAALAAAAALGDADAQFELGRLERQAGRDVEAFAWLTLATDAGHPEAPAALVTVARRLSEADLARAQARGRALRREAAARDPAVVVAVDFARAEQAAVARGRGAYDDGAYARALEILTPLAENGVADAAFLVGRMHERALGVRVQLHRAARAYATAARQGHPGALHDLARLYRDGRGVPRDLSMAVALALASATRGHEPAYLTLYELYRERQGVAHDGIMSAAWLQLAADRGNQEAADHLRTTGRHGVDLMKVRSRADRLRRQYRDTPAAIPELGPLRFDEAADATIAAGRIHARDGSYSFVLPAAWRTSDMKLEQTESSTHVALSHGAILNCLAGPREHETAAALADAFVGKARADGTWRAALDRTRLRVAGWPAVRLRALLGAARGDTLRDHVFVVTPALEVAFVLERPVDESTRDMTPQFDALLATVRIGATGGDAEVTPTTEPETAGVGTNAYTIAFPAGWTQTTTGRATRASDPTTGATVSVAVASRGEAPLEALAGTALAAMKREPGFATGAGPDRTEVSGRPALRISARVESAGVLRVIEQVHVLTVDEHLTFRFERPAFLGLAREVALDRAAQAALASWRLRGGAGAPPARRDEDPAPPAEGGVRLTRRQDATGRYVLLVPAAWEAGVEDGSFFAAGPGGLEQIGLEAVPRDSMAFEAFVTRKLEEQKRATDGFTVLGQTRRTVANAPALVVRARLATADGPVLARYYFWEAQRDHVLLALGCAEARARDLAPLYDRIAESVDDAPR